jgi:hypothetical protein
MSSQPPQRVKMSDVDSYLNILRYTYLDDEPTIEKGIEKAQLSVNNLESRNRLEPGVHDELQRRILLEFRAPHTGGRNRSSRSKKRASRKRKSQNATRRRHARN